MRPRGRVSFLSIGAGSSLRGELDRLSRPLMRWCSRHSQQTQPCTYAALVPCFRSSRRVAITAVSSAADHSRRSW